MAAIPIPDDSPAPLLPRRLLDAVTRHERPIVATQSLAAFFYLAAQPLDDGTKGLRVASMILIIVLSLVMAFAGKLSWRPVREAGVAVGALMAAVLIAVATSMVPAWSLSQLHREVVPNVAVFLCLVLWCAGDEARRYVLLRAMAAGALVSGIWTVAEFLLGKNVYVSFDSGGREYRRAEGTLDSYSRQAMYAVLSAPCAAVLAVIAWGRRRYLEAVAAALGVLAILAALLLTQTRGAWGAAAIVLFVLLAQVRFRLAMAVAVAGVLLALAIPDVRTRFTSLARDWSQPDLLLSGRLTMWKYGAAAIADNPLTGVGYGPNIFRQDTVWERYPLKNHEVRISDMHNMYLQAACETGFLGVLAYAFVLALLFRRMVKGSPWQPRGTPIADLDAHRLMTLAAMLSLAGILVYGLVHNPYEERAATVMWCMAALGFSGGWRKAPPA